MKKVKISELPLYNSLKGLFTLGTDKDNRSVKVSLEFVETKTAEAAKVATDAAAAAEKKATDAAADAEKRTNAAISNAQTTVANAAAAAKKVADDAAALATTAAQNANTKASAAAQAAGQATTAAGQANSAAQSANAAATAANTAKTETLKAKGDAETATAQAQAATAAANKSKEDADGATSDAQDATEDAIQATENLLNFLGTILPTALSVEPVPHLTLGNVAPVYINAVLSPSGVRQNIIYISDNKAVTVAPDGRLKIVGSGRSVVMVIPTINTALAKVVEVEVGEPTVRLVNTRNRIRLTASGAFRMN